jgi:hypothetical protein
MPELHFAMSTDVLQPDINVQTMGYMVMKAWLTFPGAPLLLSVVTKVDPMVPGILLTE